METKFKAWMPITKDSNGFVGILSDNSLDRDEEFMTKELLEDWAADSNPLPMLANHENKIEKLMGGWTDKQVMTKGDNSALIARPFFLKSNPLAVQTENMINEALSKGLNVGISIGAIPSETIEKEINGVKRKGYSKAEIVEATIVPIQSNRSATFMNLAKSFDINLNNKINKEVTKMAENKVKDAPAEEPKPAEVAPEEPKGEPKEVSKEEPKEKVKEEQELVDEVKSLKEDLSGVKKQLSELLEKADMRLAPTVEQPVVKKEDDSPMTIEKQISLNLGGK